MIQFISDGNMYGHLTDDGNNFCAVQDNNVKKYSTLYIKKNILLMIINKEQYQKYLFYTLHWTAATTKINFPYSKNGSYIMYLPTACWFWLVYCKS